MQNSKIEFEINHMGVLSVDGRFDEFKGFIEFENSRVKNAVMNIVVESIFTDNEERDGIIITEPYLDTKNHAYIVFSGKDSSVKSTKGIRSITGELYLRGVLRPIEFPYEIEYDKTNNTISLLAETTITRTDFNLVFGSMNSLIGDKIKIKLKLIGR